MDSKQGIHVITLANSIIGVSILAMPYCFKQCGIVLSIVLLIFSSILSRLACHFLLKSAIKSRLRTFEFLAYHVFGSLGKLFVEIGMIGFLIGTCIAFFVVMGDLSPQIIGHVFVTMSSEDLRTYILMALAVFCVLPLGLLRNVDSLSSVCTATIGFYLILVLKIMGESAPHILNGDWMDNVNYWRPAGLLQCLPIFSMALFCQTQLFEIYQAIPNASLEKMNELVRLAVNICTCVYIFVGVFGYIAISHEPNFTGNILMNFKPSIMTEIMKIGFVLSVAFSFPLVIFPCRASLHSLIYKPTYSGLHETSSIYIPENRFKMLTLFIVIVSLTIGIYIPNIELVLGLVGSTIGVMICVLFPAACFICITSKNTNERILAQIMLFVGIIVMVLGTYANLYAMEHVVSNTVIVTEKPKNMDVKVIVSQKSITIKDDQDRKVMIDKIKEVRHEPPQPEAPSDDAQKKQPQSEEKDKVVQEAPPVVPASKNLTGDNRSPPSLLKIKKEDEFKKELAEKKAKKPDDPQVVTTKKEEVVDKEAIAKEDKELRDQDKTDSLQKQQKLLEEQKKLMEENKKLLEQLKVRQELEDKDRAKVKEEQMKAVKHIESIAKLAIESIVDDKAPAETSNASANIDGLKKMQPLPLALADSAKKRIEEQNVQNNADGVNYAEKLQEIMNITHVENNEARRIEVRDTKAKEPNYIINKLNDQINKQQDHEDHLALYLENIRLENEKMKKSVNENEAMANYVEKLQEIMKINGNMASNYSYVGEHGVNVASKLGNDAIKKKNEEALSDRSAVNGNEGLNSINVASNVSIKVKNANVDVPNTNIKNSNTYNNEVTNIKTEDEKDDEATNMKNKASNTKNESANINIEATNIINEAINFKNEDAKDQEATNIKNEATNAKNEATNAKNEATNTKKDATNIKNEDAKDNDATNIKNKASNTKNEATNAKNEATNAKNEAINAKNVATNIKNEATNIKNEATNNKNEASNAKNEATNIINEAANDNEATNIKNKASNTKNEATNYVKPPYMQNEAANIKNEAANIQNEAANAKNDASNIQNGATNIHPKSDSNNNPSNTDGVNDQHQPNKNAEADDVSKDAVKDMRRDILEAHDFLRKKRQASEKEEHCDKERTDALPKEEADFARKVEEYLRNTAPKDYGGL